MTIKTSVCIALVATIGHAHAKGGQSPDLRNFLNEFHNDPVTTMGKLPPRSGALAKPFTPEQIENGIHVTSKDQFRSNL